MNRCNSTTLHKGSICCCAVGIVLLEKKVSFLYGGPLLCGLEKKKERLVHYLVNHIISVQSVYSALGPRHVSRVRQHMGDKVIEK